MILRMIQWLHSNSNMKIQIILFIFFQKHLHIWISTVGALALQPPTFYTFGERLIPINKILVW